MLLNFKEILYAVFHFDVLNSVGFGLKAMSLSQWVTRAVLMNSLHITLHRFYTQKLFLLQTRK